MSANSSREFETLHGVVFTCKKKNILKRETFNPIYKSGIEKIK